MGCVSTKSDLAAVDDSVHHVAVKHDRKAPHPLLEPKTKPVVATEEKTEVG